MTNNTTNVRVTGDASSLVLELAKAGKSSEAFAATQDAVAQRTATAQAAVAEAVTNGSAASTRAINSFVKSLAAQSQSIGKSAADQATLKAASLGVSSSVAGYINSIQAASSSTDALGHSSAGASRELLVLAHEASQGNWKRFGGSILVLGEQFDILGKLVSPTGLAFAGLALDVLAVGVAVGKGASAFNDLNKANLVTNGYLGITTDQMAALAVAMAGTTKTVSSVEEAMASLATSGRITTDQLALATTVTLGFAHDTGEEVGKAADAIVKFAEDPQKALQTLQEQYHTFSAAQVEVIENYIKSGNNAAAYTAILQGMDEAHQRTAAQATTSTSIIAEAWGYVKTNIMGALNALNQVGAVIGGQSAATNDLTNALGMQLRAREALTAIQADPALNKAYGATAQAALDSADKQVAALQKVQQAQQAPAAANAARAKGGDGAVAANKYLTSSQYATPAVAMQLENQKENEAYQTAIKNLTANGAEYEQVTARHLENLKQIKAQYAKKQGSNSGAISAQLATIAGQNKAIEQEEKRHETALKAQHDTGLIDTVTYLQDIHDAQAAALTKEIALAQQRADAAGGKKQKTAQNTALEDVKNLTAQRLALDSQLTDALDKYAATRVANVQKYSTQEDAVSQKQIDGYNRVYAAQFQTADEKSNYDASLKIYEAYQQQLAALQEKYSGPSADKQEYADKQAVAAQAYNDQSAALEASLQRDKATRESYAAQAGITFAKIGGNAQTSAQTAGTAFTTVWGDLSNGLDTFVTTGKLNFTSFATSVIQDMEKIALKAAENSLFQQAASALTDAFAPAPTQAVSAGQAVALNAHAAGGYISGPGTGTSDSITALLSNGEFVNTAASTGKYRSLLEAINSGADPSTWPRYATGGMVGSSAAPAGPNVSGGGSGSSTNISVEIVNNGSQASQVQSATPTIDVNGIVLKVVLTDLQKGGPIRRAVQNLPAK